MELVTRDIAEDFDGDGVCDLGEYLHGLNVTNKDTDGDGVNDKDDYDPLNPNIQTKWDVAFELVAVKLLIAGVIGFVFLSFVLSVGFLRRGKYVKMKAEIEVDREKIEEDLKRVDEEIRKKKKQIYKK